MIKSCQVYRSRLVNAMLIMLTVDPFLHKSLSLKAKVAKSSLRCSAKTDQAVIGFTVCNGLGCQVQEI